MAVETVGAILDEIKASWPVANDLEVTLEANPTSVEASKFKGFRDAGVTRVSMGIQALNDGDLKRLGRLHSVKEAKDAYDVARHYFERVSFDLIYARQDQTADAWRAELSEALSMAADHLSLYQLTIEPGTAFGDRFARGKLQGLPDSDVGAELYDITQALCEEAGLPAYEISNHAADMSESRHNLIYWRYGDYAGIGPGAHGRLTLDGQRFATETPLAPLAWLRKVETTGSGYSRTEALSGPEQATEYAMMSMRLLEGMDLSRFVSLGGSPLSASAIDHLEGLGLVTRSDNHLIATSDGRRLLNAVLSDLLS